MKIVIILVSISLSIVNLAYTQKYDVASIPEELKKNANAVIRWDEATYTVQNLNTATYKSHEVITILKNDALRLSKHDLWYDINSEIVSIEGRIYNSLGNLIKEVKKKDIQDAAYSSYSIFDDNRYKYIDLSSKNLPFTIELIYERKYKNLFYVNDWYTIPGNNISVEHSKYTTISPSAYNPKYKILNSDLSPVVTRDSELIKSVFEFNNLAAQEKEPYGPYVSKTSPKVLLTPRKFSFDGYDGSFNTWDDFSIWMKSLIKGRTDLTPKAIAKAKSLTQNLTTDKEKIQAIYEYLQENTRYVSIQLGIGGYQPFPAMTVDEMGYGDCKALSNYTHSLLAAIDIKSHHVLVDAGSNPRKIDSSFPNNTFNHMILCVPNKGDTLWLECTSQTNPFGYQGRFTGDRDVLLITESGGEIVHTTVYNKKDNIQSRTAQVKIDKSGNGSAHVLTQYQGLQYENNNLDSYVDRGYDEQKKWTLENTDIPSFDLVNFSLDVSKASIPSIYQTLEVNLTSYAQSSGERLFLPLNLMNKHTYVPKRITERQTDVQIKTPFIDLDSIVYLIPEGIHPESVPNSTKFSTEFGEYESNIVVESGKVTYVRKFGMNKGTYPKASYDDLRGFLKKVKKADNAKVVFLKNT